MRSHAPQTGVRGTPQLEAPFAHCRRRGIRGGRGRGVVLDQGTNNDDRFEIVAPHPLNLVCVAVRGDDGDAATDALIDAANASGEALFTRTVLDGRSVLRISIGARSTQRHHVESAWQLLDRLA